MRFGSVCSGIEAASCAWEPLGWRAAWFAEIEKFPSQVLAHHFPQTPNMGTMVNLAARLVGAHREIDLLVGGTPCQSFSVAGLRGGLADERGNLALEYVRLVDALRPRWTVWENVPGVLSSAGGRDFGAIVGALGELGYGWAYRVLDAQYFGVPQRRRRVFLVGCARGAAAAAAVLFEPESVRRNSAPGGKARKEIANGTAPGPSSDSGKRWPARVAPTLDRSFGEKQGQDNQHVNGGCGLFVPQRASTITKKGINSLAVDEADNFIVTAEGSSCVSLTKSNIKAGSQNNQTPLVVMSSGQGGASIDSDVSPTLTRLHEAPIVATSTVRRLTPVECERLQGFPDGWTAIPGAADGPRYAALGNSMAVPVMRWIGERIQKVDDALAKR